MSLCAQLLRPARQGLTILRKFSIAAEVTQIPAEPLQVFRTLENYPANHNADHLNRFYTVSPETQQLLFQYGGLPKKFSLQIETFLEFALMVRSPAIEIISYLNHTDYTRPPNKYVLYGEMGTGKTLTLAHLLHYATDTKKIIVHVPWVPSWFKHPKEVATSQTKEGYYDLPVDGAAWLVHFKHQNNKLLSQLDIPLSKDYHWSSREVTTAGSPLMELVDFGINRIKFSCDVVATLIDELKLASTAGRCNTFIAIDGFNAFYSETSKVKNDDKKWVKPIHVSLTDAFLNATTYDWCNGAIVVTVDPIASMTDDYERSKGLPFGMLGKDGFEHLDPFLPVEVGNYTPEEFESMMEYYRDRKWVRNLSKEGQRELELMSARNPYNLMIRTTVI